MVWGEWIAGIADIADIEAVGRKTVKPHNRITVVSRLVVSWFGGLVDSRNRSCWS